MKFWCKISKFQKSQTTCIHSQELQPWRLFCLDPPVQTSAAWEASLNRCACFCVTSDQVASSGMARSLWTGGRCETRNETKVETIFLNQTAITARGDGGSIILCQQFANTNTFNSFGRKGIMHEHDCFLGVKPPEQKNTHNFTPLKRTWPSSQQPQAYKRIWRPKFSPSQLPPMHRASQMFGG